MSNTRVWFVVLIAAGLSCAPLSASAAEPAPGANGPGRGAAGAPGGGSGTGGSAPRENPVKCGPGKSPWTCVAECESSGRWNANTGNGYYGGLQFWQPTWKEFGGLAHAPRADLATPAQQVEIAEKVLLKQGPGAWPVCSKRVRFDRRLHTVRPGETLSSIAARYHVKGGWQELYRVNRKMIGPHPDRLNVGTVLSVPVGAEGRKL